MKPQKSTRAEIVLGNPNLKCARFGICKIEKVATFGNEILPLGKVYANIVLRVPITIFTFHRKTMSDTTFLTHFSNGQFLIESDTTINQANVKYQIQKGIYPVSKQGIYLKIFVESSLV